MFAASRRDPACNAQAREEAPIGGRSSAPWARRVGCLANRCGAHTVTGEHRSSTEVVVGEGGEEMLAADPRMAELSATWRADAITPTSCRVSRASTVGSLLTSVLPVQRLLGHSEAAGDLLPRPPGSASLSHLVGFELLGQGPQARRSPQRHVEIPTRHCPLDLTERHHAVSLG